MSRDTITIRSLRTEDLPSMYKAFKSAFHDYVIPFDLSEEHFRKKFVQKLNIDLDLSAGAFDKEGLKGFIFTSTSSYEGVPVAYNGGTGVVPPYRGNGITNKLYDFLLPHFKNHDIDFCVLEVLTTNRAAIKVYKNIGFRVSRKYKCFKLKPALPVSSKANNKVKISPIQSPDWTTFMQFSDYIPSYLDSQDMIEKNLANEVVIEAELDGKVAGYAIFQPAVGRISHIAVDKAHREMGVGSMLLRHIYEKSENKDLTIINIPDEAHTMLHFLGRSGFENELDQYEMRLLL